MTDSTDDYADQSMHEDDDLPFIDTSGEHPKALTDCGGGGKCRGSSVFGGECTKMGLEFDSIQEWREHRDKHHPVFCERCAKLSAYKRDHSPTSYCFEHVPDDPDLVYAWKRTNTKSVVEPTKADDDHPIEAALKGVDE